jgi:hypothetical protein
MEISEFKKKQRRFGISSAVTGLVIAGILFLLSETDPRPGSAGMLWLSGISMVLCPGSLAFVTVIDIEPQTNAFAIMWLIIGVLNFILYGGLGLLVSRSIWRVNRTSNTV